MEIQMFSLLREWNEQLFAMELYILQFAFTIDLLSLLLENQKAWLAGYGVTRYAIGVATDAGRVRDLVIILMTQQQRDLRCLQSNAA